MLSPHLVVWGKQTETMGELAEGLWHIMSVCHEQLQIGLFDETYTAHPVVLVLEGGQSWSL